MPEFYEPILNLTDPEHHNTMGAFLTLKDPVNGEILRDAVEALRARFPYFYVRAGRRGEDIVPVPNGLPMTVRNTWEPISFHSEASNYHMAAWKFEGRRLAFEITHSLTDGDGFLPYVKSAMYLYLTKAAGRAFDPAGFRLPGETIPESETGNPFQGLDIDGAEKRLYLKEPITDFFRLANGTERDKTAYCLKIPEGQMMRYCRKHDGSPNVFLSVMLARAARRLNPENEKTVTVSVCIDQKAMVGNHDNYRMFVGDALLDFPKNRDLSDLPEACTIARGQLILQAQPENTLWQIRQMKQGLPPPSPDTALASICVSYPVSRSFGPLDPWIEELFIMTSLMRITDILCLASCVNHTFFISLLQPFASDAYFRCFLEELKAEKIGFEVVRSEPLRLCGIG